MSTSKLKTKYEVQSQCGAFLTAAGATFNNKIQVSRDGTELLCDNVDSISIIDVATGQASRKSDIPSTEHDDKIILNPESEENDEESLVEDAFKGAKIEMAEGDIVTAMQLSPDGTKLLVACKSLLLKLYSWPDRSLVKQFRSYHAAHIVSLCWDASSTLCVSGSSDHTARVWDVARSCSTHCLRGAPGAIWCVALHPRLSEHPLCYVGAGSVLCVWKLSAGSSEMIHKLDTNAHYMNITGLVMACKGKYLISYGLERVLMVWDAVTMQQVRAVVLGQGVGGASVIPSPPSEEDEASTFRLAVAGENGHVSVYRVSPTGAKEVYRTPEPVVQLPKQKTFEGEENNKSGHAITSLHYTKALNSIVITSYDNNVLFLKLKEYNPDKVYKKSKAEITRLPVWKMLCGNNDHILATIFVDHTTDIKKDEDNSEDASVTTEYLVVASNSPELRMYRTSDLSCRLLRGHTNIVMALARHPAFPSVFGSSSQDATVRIWRTTEDGSAVCVALVDGHAETVTSLTLGLDMLISASKDTTIKRWILSEEKLSIVKTECNNNIEIKADEDNDIKTNGHEDDNNIDTKAKKKSKNLKCLASASSTMTPNSLNCSHTEIGHKKDVNSIAVSPKDKLVATGSEDKTIKIYQGLDLSTVGTLRGHRRGVWCVQFSPVDKLLASASADSTIKLWLLDTMALAASLESHTSGVLNVCWMNRGLQLLSCSSAGLVKVWETKTRVCHETIMAHEDSRVWALCTQGDGERFVTGGEDAKFVIWKDITKELRQKEAQEKQRIQSEQQTLANLMRQERWAEALLLTLRLQQPYNAIKVVRGLLREGSSGSLESIIAGLSQHHLGTLIRFTVQWNTRASTCSIAQTILHLLLTTRLPESLERVPFWQHSLEAALSYTERHYKRMAALHQSSAILSYCQAAVTITDTTATLCLGETEDSKTTGDVINDLELLNSFRPPPSGDGSKDTGAKDGDSSDSDDENDGGIEGLNADMIAYSPHPPSENEDDNEGREGESYKEGGSEFDSDEFNNADDSGME